LLWHAWRATGIDLSQDFINEDLYYKFVHERWMTETWFILNPVAILDFLGVPVKRIVKRPASYKPREDELLVGQFKAKRGISHFVPVDRRGRVLYDSWHNKEGGSRAVRDGQLMSWRVFTT